MLLSLALLLLAADAPAAPQYDLIVRGGVVIDGSGNPWFRGDVAVAGDRIVAWMACRAGLSAPYERIAES